MQWKDGAARVPTLRTHPMQPEVPCPAAWLELLVPGSLWVLRHDLARDDRFSAAAYKQHEFPYLQKHYLRYYGDDLKVASKGTVAVYTGTTRVEEETHKGMTLQVVRHTFLVQGARYMLLDVMDLEPVKSA